MSTNEPAASPARAYLAAAAAVLALALFWPLDQIAANAGKVHWEDVPRPLLWASAVTALSTFLAQAVARQAVAGAYVASAWVLLFWGAGGVAKVGASLGVPAVRGPLPLVVVLAAGLVAARLLGAYLRARPASGKLLGGVLGILAGVFFLPALTRVGWSLAAEPPPPIVFSPVATGTEEPARARPDIYLILLDGYARADVLEDLYQADDGPFRRRLESQGFQVAPDALSNYVGTLHSVASLLNLEYLPDTAELAARAPQDHRPLRASLESPALLALARRAGYRLRLVGTGSDVWDPRTFDDFLDPGPTALDHLLMRQSALGQLFPARFHGQHRGRLRAALRAAPAPPGGPPALTILHLLAPHPPFVFGSDCGPFEDSAPFQFHVDHEPILDALVRPGYYRAGYRAQVGCLGQLVGDLAADLVSPEKRPAVVWVFGDHGPRALPMDAPAPEVVRERTAIIHALHVPDQVVVEVPTGTSLVQTARSLARGLFGVELPSRPRRVFHHRATNEYRLVEHPPPQSPDPG